MRTSNVNMAEPSLPTSPEFNLARLGNRCARLLGTGKGVYILCVTLNACGGNGEGFKFETYPWITSKRLARRGFVYETRNNHGCLLFISIRDGACAAGEFERSSQRVHHFSSEHQVQLIHVTSM